MFKLILGEHGARVWAGFAWPVICCRFRQLARSDEPALSVRARALYMCTFKEYQCHGCYY
jgi:hypothetical protein